MPVFFQHTAFNFDLVVWRMEEPASFFEASLPPSIKQAAPSHPDRRLQFLTGRFLLKTLMPDFPIDQIALSSSGRPFLPDEKVQFSISHTALFAAAMVSQTLFVGIDVEGVSEKPGRVRRKFLSEAEEQLMRENAETTCPLNDDALYTLAWSVKEAAFKSLLQTGVDFIRDLPIEEVECLTESWEIKLGGKGSGLAVQAQLLEGIFLAYATRRWNMGD